LCFFVRLDTKIGSQNYKRKRVSAFIINEMIIRFERSLFWLWIAIEPVYKIILVLMFQMI